MSMNPAGGFTLSQMIESVADDLREIKNSPPEDPVMEFTDCELEIAVTVGAEAGGKFKFWVVDASSKVKAETVSKVTVRFKSNGISTIIAPAIDPDSKGPKIPKNR